MSSEPEKLIETVTSSYASARSIITKFSHLLSFMTFKIKRGKPDENIAALETHLTLTQEQKQMLVALSSTKPGANFIDEKIQDMNRSAFHRSAFLLNAFLQFFFVDIGAQMAISIIWIKVFFVVVNLILAFIAHISKLMSYDELLAGPNALPPRRRLFGLLTNRRYNRAVKKKSRPYARQAWRENNLYRPAYFINATLIFIGGQFILPLDRLIFPFGLIFGKIIGLLTTLATIFDVWRGIKSGDDARIAREKEVSIYRDLNL
jgi:hypothetical protein